MLNELNHLARIKDTAGSDYRKGRTAGRAGTAFGD